MTRAAIYARISDDRGGAGLGVARQIKDCRDLAEQRGWSVVEVYEDNDITAYGKKRRPRYDAMMADLEGGLLDAIVVYHQDRLTRRPAEFEAFLTACQSAGMKKFTTVTGFTDLGHGDGVMVARIQAAVAANSSDAASRRVRRKNDERANSGLPHQGGPRSFGFERDRVTIREEEAVVIRQLAARFLAGESLTSLVAWLQDIGIKTATGKNEWRTPTVRGLLLRPSLAGLREHRGEVVGKGSWPAIITPEQHYAIRDKLLDPTRRVVRSPRRYALSGLVRCGLCGGKMVSAPDSGRRRYGCRSGPDFGGCGKVYVAADALDRLMADAVLLRLDTPAMAADLAGRLDVNEEHQEVSDLVRADNDQLAELATAYANKDISMRDWLTAKRPIESRRDALQKRLTRLTNSDTLSPLVGNGSTLRKEWDGLGLTRQAAIISAVLDHVVIQPASRASNRLDIGRVHPIWRA